MVSHPEHELQRVVLWRPSLSASIVTQLVTRLGRTGRSATPIGGQALTLAAPIFGVTVASLDCCTWMCVILTKDLRP